MATFTLMNRLKRFSQHQKESIKERLTSEGELPWQIQLFIAVGLWIVLFVFMFILWSVIVKWGLVIIAIIGSIVLLETFNFVIKRRLRKEENNEEFETEISTEIVENTILLGNLYKKGGIVLVSKRKDKLLLTPLISLVVHSYSSSSKSLFNSLSNVSLQKISLKYHCSIVDTSNYEVLILKGKTLQSKEKSMNETIETFQNTFFLEAFELISELQRERRIELEKPNLNILKELFPSFKVAFDQDNSNGIESTDSISEELEEISDKKEAFEELISEKEIVEESKPLIKKKNDSVQRKRLKEVLLSELDFSIDSFLESAKSCYKKAIESNLDEIYSVNIDKFLKTVHLYCDKKAIEFFYPSYSYLLKIIEFLEIELPSSADIENYVERLTDEYTSVKIPTELLEDLKAFLDEKFRAKSNNNHSDENNPRQEVSSIPIPPSKSDVANTTKGGEMND
jgi:hypothetical protein